MSNEVTLSAATRQNLLALQDTAALTATTQNRLATGKKVSSALDNPVNFFTAQSLSNRSSDLNGLLDGISNGIQVIQAANQGITSIQKLIDSAKSITSQALASKNAVAGTPVTTTTHATASVTAANDFAATTAAQTVSFTVNGVAKDATIAAAANPANTTQDLTDAVAALNLAAGGTYFSGANGKITVASTDTNISIGAQESTKLGFTAAVAGTDTSTTTTPPGTDATRTSLATQFNSLLTQIDQLAKDASYNGINLISSGDASNKLHISFNEKDTTSLDIQGVDLTTGTNGLAIAAAVNDFQTDADVTAAVTALTTATGKLRAQASTFGSNLSVVQNRQDFTKHLINILGTGSSNLTDADLNEEAANSQALSTRQSLGISALSLANQAQQGILQLLR